MQFFFAVISHQVEGTGKDATFRLFLGVWDECKCLKMKVTSFFLSVLLLWRRFLMPETPEERRVEGTSPLQRKETESLGGACPLGA